MNGHTTQIEQAPCAVLILGLSRGFEYRFRCPCGAQGRWHSVEAEAQFDANVHRNDIALDVAEAL